MAKDPYKYFLPEARDLLDQLGKGVLDLEKGRGHADVVQRLLRLAHTLKGAARVVKQVAIADHAHAIEDALAPFRDSGDDVPPDRIDRLLSLVDGIGERIIALVPAPPGRPSPDESVPTIRAGVAEMDALLDSVIESHVHLRTLHTTIRSVDRARQLADRLVKQLALRSVSDGGAAATPAARHVYATAEELRQVLVVLDRQVDPKLDQLDRELRQVRAAAEQLRLTPVRTIFTSLERTARDTAQALGKRTAFESTGGDVRLEAHVLGPVQRALLQAVRNAVAHGIESEAERKTAEKPLAGRVTIDVTRRGRLAVFRCQDDGRGVDLEAVRRVAARKGLSAPGTASLQAQDLMRLLLRGGITTSSAVTEVSGRGVGLDVMREVAEQLGGEVIVLTEEGKGTTFELVIPLSLASVEALVLESGGVAAAIPFDCVRRTLRVMGDEISTAARHESIVHEGRVIPFVVLSRALGMRTPAGRSDRARSIVIVEGAAGIAAIGVDRFQGTARIVLRPLPALTFAESVVAGTYLDTEGNPQLVLDPDGLIGEAIRADGRNVGLDDVHRSLLVIDDSLTTRMLEQSILESAGYDVDAAVSGEDALECARLKRYALFLVDVEMPGMDGFTFIERTRADPALRDIPAILVTSRNAVEDRQRGQDVGAQGYIVKSEFNQAELLARIRQLVE